MENSEVLMNDLLSAAREQGKTLEASYSGIVGLVITVLRDQRHWSQNYLSRISRISQPTISRIELGESDITIPQIDAIADALETTSSFILDVADELRGRLKREQVTVYRKKDKTPANALKGAAMVAATGAVLGGGPIGFLIGSLVGAIIASRKDDHEA